MGELGMHKTAEFRSHLTTADENTLQLGENHQEPSRTIKNHQVFKMQKKMHFLFFYDTWLLLCPEG
jgi:hypothetical protein